jgi:hypothetical protein
MSIAAYNTTGARFKLYLYLSTLHESVLYCDIHSLIYIQNVTQPLEVTTGEYLGDLTYKLEEYN